LKGSKSDPSKGRGLKRKVTGIRELQKHAWDLEEKKGAINAHFRKKEIAKKRERTSRRSVLPPLGW